MRIYDIGLDKLFVHVRNGTFHSKEYPINEDVSFTRGTRTVMHL